ncbi:MAG TPA: HAD hydrolase-like protein [bacterium]|nr:HAD hydrolase-like protein [bacterium]HPN44338.1 HAD hydrolase-like protein [bacterium]
MSLKYKHVLWDWNGTLLDDMWLCVDVINELLGKYGKPKLSYGDYQQHFDFPVRDYYERIGFEFDKVPFEVVGTEYINNYYRRWHECTLHKDVKYVLGAIQKAGFTQSILSAADVKMLYAGVELFGLQGYFNELTGLNHHYADGKIGIAREYMQRQSLKPQQFLYIGDTTHDCQVAREIGVDVVLFTNGHHTPERLQDCGAPLIHSLRQTLPMLGIE